MLDFDVWEYSLENSRKKRRKNAEDFLNEVGYDFDVTQLSPRESIMYDFAKKEVDELVREHNQALNNISKQQNPYLDTTDTTESYQVAENEGPQKSDATQDDNSEPEQTVYKTRSDGNRICTPLELNDLDSYDLSYKGYNQKDNKLLVNAEKLIMSKVGEDYKYHIYLDSKCKISTGIGANIDDYNDFMKLDWQKDCRPATRAEKEEAYKQFLKIKNSKKCGKQYAAGYYENESPLYITDTLAIKKMREHLIHDIEVLRDNFDDFDDFPEPLKEVLVDFRYNTGNITRKNHPHLRDAIDKKDLSLIERWAMRPEIQDDRRAWILEKLHSIPEENGWHRSKK